MNRALIAAAAARPHRLGVMMLAALSMSVLVASCSSSSGSKPGAGGTSTSSAGSATHASSAPGNGGSQPATSPATGAASGASTVDIKNFMFTPMSLTVPVGGKVTWKFEDAANHTVVADDRSFSSPSMSNGQTFSHTFSKAGTYKYTCSIHPYMTGSIVVK